MEICLAHGSCLSEATLGGDIKGGRGERGEELGKGRRCHCRCSLETKTKLLLPPFIGEEDKVVAIVH